MKFSKSELRRVRMALVRAVDWEESLIDAHRTKLVRRDGRMEKIVAPDNRRYVAVCKRRMAGFKKLLAKMSGDDIDESSPRG